LPTETSQQFRLVPELTLFQCRNSESKSVGRFRSQYLGDGVLQADSTGTDYAPLFGYSIGKENQAINGA
jgi:hypothetical protein